MLVTDLGLVNQYIMINTDQIIQCASELGYELSLEDAKDVLNGEDGWNVYEGVNVWDATTEWLNIYETCIDFWEKEYEQVYLKWKKII